MSENKIAFKQEDITEQDYREFEKKLFSPSTPVSQLEKICKSRKKLTK